MNSLLEPEEDESEPLWTQGNDEDDHDEAGSSADSLYAILNLDKSCSQEDIQRAYKRLAVLLHPDRHSDPELKSAADSRFQAVNRAYGVLSDERQRAIYDALGEEGLKANMQVGQKLKSAQELREEFAKMSAKQRQVTIESLVKSKGEITCTTDARLLFMPTEERIALGGPPDMSAIDLLSTVHARQVFLKHSFNTDITEKTSLNMISQLLTRQGSGGGNMILKLVHRPASTMSIELGTTVLRPRLFTFKTTYAPDNDSFATFEFPMRTLAAPPQLSMTIGRRVTSAITSTFGIRTGNYSLFGWWGEAPPISDSSFTLSFIHNHGHSVALTAGLLGSQLNGEYVWTVYRSVKVRASASVNSLGLVGGSLGADGRITEFVRAGMGLETSQNGTMVLKLRLMRLGQRISVPVIVSSRFSGTLALSFTLLPSLAFIGAQHYLIQPRKRRKMSTRVKELRKEHEAMISERKKEAEEAVRLLKEHTEKRQEDERRKNGLVIDEATYGVLDSVDESIDVTVPTAALVASSQLIVPGGRSKSHLLGFYDCAMGSKKRLRVKYTFKGRPHETTVSDAEPLALPVRAHLIE